MIRLERYSSDVGIRDHEVSGADQTGKDGIDGEHGGEQESERDGCERAADDEEALAAVSKPLPPARRDLAPSGAFARR